MIIAAISLAIFAQAPAKPLDEATFLREASKGWAVLEKAYADIEVKYRSESHPSGTRDEESFYRLGERIRAERGDRIFPDRPQKFPGFTRAYVTDGTAYFVADRMAPDAPFVLQGYHKARTAEDDRTLKLYALRVRQMCFLNGLRPWSEEIKREGFSITRLETIKEGSRELIRMEFRENDQPAEVSSILRGWCVFDPRENYLPVESETEYLMHARNTMFIESSKVEHKRSDAFPGLRVVPARMSRSINVPQNQVITTTIYEIETFAPCKLKPADFRPEAFGLKTPK